MNDFTLNEAIDDDDEDLWGFLNTPAAPPPELLPNEEQLIAIQAMVDFLSPSCKEQFLLLLGPAGTGKTFTIKQLFNRIRGKVVLTAPTNKATKVIRDTFLSGKIEGGITPACRTIYSLLGLKMEPDGEIKRLISPEDPVDLSKLLCIVVDEISMANKVLWYHIKETAETQGVKFIFMGDRCQLPPVKETSSIALEVENRFELTRVMRHDNQILTLATRIRETMDNPFPSMTFSSDWDGEQGIQKVDQLRFIELIKREAERGEFSKQSSCKAIAWRNVAVDSLNVIIRRTIFPDASGDFFPGDRVILLEPAASFTDKRILAHTDDEGTIESSLIDYHPECPEMKCYRLVVQIDGGHPITLWKLHPESLKRYTKKLADLAGEAKIDRSKWKYYWMFKENFHNVRYGYAITAHRSQGSTYDKVFVNAGDIMLNRNRVEAFKCLYVAVTRAKKVVVIT